MLNDINKGDILLSPSLIPYYILNFRMCLIDTFSIDYLL